MKNNIGETDVPIPKRSANPRPIPASEHDQCQNFGNMQAKFLEIFNHPQNLPVHIGDISTHLLKIFMNSLEMTINSKNIIVHFLDIPLNSENIFIRSLDMIVNAENISSNSKNPPNIRDRSRYLGSRFAFGGLTARGFRRFQCSKNLRNLRNLRLKMDWNPVFCESVRRTRVTLVRRTEQKVARQETFARRSRKSGVFSQP